MLSYVRCLLLSLVMVSFCCHYTYAAPTGKKSQKAQSKKNKSTKSTKSTKSANNENMVDINKDSQEKLATLKGIGPAKAKKITEYRKEYLKANKKAKGCAFQTADDLAKVKGIGKKTVEKNRDRIIACQKK